MVLNCDRKNLLLQEKQGGNNSDMINDEIIAILDKLLEHKCISKKQRKQILFKGNLLLIQMYEHKYNYKYV